MINAAFLLTVWTVFAPTEPPTGILVMAHGGDETWNQDVEAAVSPLREKYPTEIAFGMARTSTLRKAVERLEEQGVRRIAVVRMFISGDSFVEETEYILGLRGELRAPVETPANPHGGDHCAEKPEPIPTKSAFILSREGVANSPLVDQILVDRVKALSTNPSEESVLVLAHGPGDDAENERWLGTMNRRAERIRELGAFREIRCETLREDWPEKRAEAERRIRNFVEEGNANGKRVIVVPFRVAGFGPYKEVLEGLTYVSDGRGFCPHPNMTRWIEQTANESLAESKREVAARP
jgi:sirohydrochlorin cobaltochelatase